MMIREAWISLNFYIHGRKTFTSAFFVICIFIQMGALRIVEDIIGGVQCWRTSRSSSTLSSPKFPPLEVQSGI